VSARRLRSAADVGERFFALMTLGETNVVHSTYVLGARAYARAEQR